MKPALLSKTIPILQPTFPRSLDRHYQEHKIIEPSPIVSPIIMYNRFQLSNDITPPTIPPNNKNKNKNKNIEELLTQFFLEL